MAAIRRHWRMLLVAVACAGVVLAAGMWRLGGERHQTVAADQPPAPAGLTAVEREQVRQVRAEIGLSNEMLAAMACSGTQAEQLLTAVSDWCRNNSAGLEEKRKAIVSARHRLDAVVQRVNVGPPDPALQGTVRELQQAWAAAVADRRKLIDALMTSIEASLSEGQRPTYRAGRQSTSSLGDYRYVASLTAAQARAVRAVLSERASGLMTARTPEASAAVERAAQTRLQEALTAAQQDEQRAVQTRKAAALADVLAAEERVLPVASER